LVENENTFTMQQLAASVNEFLNFRKYKILQGKGKVSKVAAEILMRRVAELRGAKLAKTEKI